MSKTYAPSAELLLQYKQEVLDRSREIDPGYEHDWFSIGLGWALAKGLTPDEARDFAMHIVYTTGIG